MSVRRWTCLPILVALIATAGPLLASARAATRTDAATVRTVGITASGPVPKSVTIALGASVRWVNNTSRPHTLTAERGAFPAFALSPHASHTVKFTRTGRYPYRIDGRFKGTIVVVAGGSAPGGQTGGGKSACRAFCELHYAVAIKGVRTYKDISTVSDPDASGRTEIYLEWTGQIPNAKVTVMAGGHTEIVGDGAGSAQATVRFLESRPLWGGACQGNTAARLKIKLEMSVAVTSTFFDLSVEENGLNFFGSVVKPAMDKACPGGALTPRGGLVSRGPSTTSLSLQDVPGPYGTTWFVATSSYLRIGIERKHGTLADVPFTLLRSGRPFELQRRLYTRTGRGCVIDDCATTDIMEYTLTFTPKN